MNSWELTAAVLPLVAQRYYRHGGSASNPRRAFPLLVRSNPPHRLYRWCEQYYRQDRFNLRFLLDLSFVHKSFGLVHLILCSPYAYAYAILCCR